MPVWVISDDQQRAWYQKGHSGRTSGNTLKETARGDLATTRTALEVKNRLKM